MNAHSIIGIISGSTALALAVFSGLVIVTPLWDALAERYCKTLSQRFIDLGIPILQLRLILRVWGLAVLGSVAIGFFVGAIPLGIAVGLFIVTMPSHILKFFIARRETKLRDQMVLASKAMANSVQVGMSLKQAFEIITVDTNYPLRKEFERIVFEVNHGRLMADVLQQVRDRLNIDAFSMFAAAIGVNLERGGHLNEPLERISYSLQENQRLDRKLAADTSAGRHMLFILALFPLLFLVFFSTVDPAGTSLLVKTFIGQLILVGVGGIVYLGVKWGQRVMAIEM